MADSKVRKRVSKQNGSANKSDSGPLEVEDNSSRVVSPLDILRIFITLIVASLTLSYYITSGESLLWGYRPWFTKPALVAQYVKGPVTLTSAQLALYNGTDHDLPIYFAINNTIYDVTAGAHTYGPGGSYNVFAGHHATRAFVTGCFAEDLTNDLRGAEMMHIPVEDDEYEVISSGDKKIRAEKEKRAAKKKIEAEVRKWASFYQDSKKYFPAGRVIGEEQSAFKGEQPRLCDQAEKGRSKRSKLNSKKGREEENHPGKAVQ